MQNLHKRLLLVLTNLIALPSFCPAQLRELGIGTHGPVKAQHSRSNGFSRSARVIDPWRGPDTIRQTGTKTQGQTAVPTPAGKIGGET